MMKHSIFKYLLAAVLMLVAMQTVRAQDAFYIYRNDGDFNGFFFDEVVRMGYSKIGVDSVEYDTYVVQEVETADSLYRIPLAAIDSIGFQQPEIKLNPKVKFIEKCGLLPYLQGGRNGSVVFYDVPDDLRPQIGDVLIGLPTDKHADNVNYIDGSFSCVVERIVQDRWDSCLFTFYGRAVENISDVFEQYITLEDLGYDKDGNLVRRRVAGMPRSDNDGIDLLTLQGTIQREWNPDENSSVSLSADVGVTYSVRLTYNIGWTRFFVKLVRDLVIDVEPKLSMAVSRGFNVSLGNSIAGFGIPLPIWFPTECPIFELEPYPDWFVRGEGKVEASLKFPKTHFGFGEDIIFDSKRLFPIDYDTHWVTEKNTNDNDIIDVGSTNVNLSGFVQTGLKFHVSIGTASWFKKIFHCDLGVDIYTGPKIDGSMEFSTDWINNEGFNLYSQLRKSSINVSWLSVDLEAKTTASVLWKTPMEKTFFSTSFPFFCDTIRFIPRMELKDVEVKKDEARFTYKTFHDKQLGSLQCDFILKDRDGKESLCGSWAYNHSDDDYTGSISFNGLKAGNHSLWRRLSWAGFGPFDLEGFNFKVPYTMELSTDSLEFEGFDPSGKMTKSVFFTTNCPKKDIYIHVGGRYKTELVVLNEGKGHYEVQITAANNTDIISDEKINTVTIRLGSGEFEFYYIKCIQKAAPPSALNYKLAVYGKYNNYNSSIRDYRCTDPIVVKIPNGIIVDHSYETTKEENGRTYYDKGSISFTMCKEVDSLGISHYTITDGKAIMKSKDYTSSRRDEYENEYTFGPLTSTDYSLLGGKLNSATSTGRSQYYPRTDEFGNSYEEWTQWFYSSMVMDPELDNFITISFEVTDPTSQTGN